MAVSVVFFGPPGSGKGTQAALLARALGVPQVSTGELLRGNIARGTELGRLAKPIMETGALVPDDLVTRMLEERLALPDAAQGALFDGYPRTLTQAEALDALPARSGQRVDLVLFIDVRDEVIVDRLTRRSSVEGRTDDSPETVRERLRVYREVTAPVAEHYKRAGRFLRIEGDRPVADVHASVMEAVDRVVQRPGTVEVRS